METTTTTTTATATTSTTTGTTGAPRVAEQQQQQQQEIILPPPTPRNPIPSLPIALRVDNQEQLLHLLQSDPRITTTATTTTSWSSHSSFSQLLVFGTDALRTLLLRQVLSNPATRVFVDKKKNWDPVTQFPWPKGLSSSIVGTRLLTAPNEEAPEKDWEDMGRNVVDVITYFIRPSHIQHTTQVVQRIQAWDETQRKRNTTSTTHHRLVYLPQPTALVQKILHNHRLDKNVSIHHLQLDVFPIETDVLSLEYDNAWSEVALQSTPSTVVTTVARSLLKLQDICGKIPRFQSYGPTGEEVVRNVWNGSVEEYLTQTQPPPPAVVVQGGGGDFSVAPGDIAACIVLDRKLDLVTPMISPLTYEGLLDDVVGINTGFVQVPLNIIHPDDDEDDDDDDDVKETKTSAASKQSKKKQVVALGVTGNERLYAEVRDQHVEKFGSFLQNQAVALRESHANFTSHGKKKDLSEIHQFVRNIPVFTRNFRSLTNHIHLAELVKKTSEEVTFRERWQMERSMLEGDTCYDLLDDLVATQYPPFRFLRLLCLQSLCAGGIKSNRYDSLRRDVVQTYGYEFLLVLNHLEKAGLLRRRDGLWMDSTSPFNSLRRSLILINAEVDTVEPDDVSYVSSGYAPLSVRIIQTAVKGWTGRDDILREVGGRMVDVMQQDPPEDLAAAVKRPAAGPLGTWATEWQSQTSSSRKPILLVTYVGGVTYTEIAALRFLSKRPSFPFHIICLTTKVINGTTFLKSLC